MTLKCHGAWYSSASATSCGAAIWSPQLGHFPVSGIDPATDIHDSTGRPYRLAEGEPIRDLFGQR